jgi:hypothetical protein
MSKRKAVVVDEVLAAKKTAKITKVPKTLKEKILYLLATEDTLVSLPTLKKLLRENYDIDDTSANNNKLNKTLKALLEEDEDDFGKIGGSYHGGKNSLAFLEYEVQRTARELKQADDKLHENDVKCCYCLTWCDSMETWKGEDSIARGGIHKCSNDACKRTFYTWISGDHRIGHEVEYKRGGSYLS